jgi:hypothetical protein
MDNPSFQDDSVPRVAKVSATPERTAKKSEVGEKPLQRKPSYGYQPRSRSNRKIFNFMQRRQKNCFMSPDARGF